MKDLELLKLAAKAAGIDTAHQPYSDSIHISTGGLSWKHWNPLADDGDALRLAVKLGLEIKVTPVGAIVLPHERPGPVIPEWHDNGDHTAATRRAIVRAAAEIGSSCQAAD